MWTSFYEKGCYLHRVYNGFGATGNYVGVFPDISHIFPIWFFITLNVVRYFAINYKPRSFSPWLNILSWFVWHESIQVFKTITLFYLVQWTKNFSLYRFLFFFLFFFLFRLVERKFSSGSFREKRKACKIHALQFSCTMV